jgi:hypothetical protein
MSFQWIIDNAVDVDINRYGLVSQTISRNQTVRSVSRGGKVTKFVVTPSPGTIWQDSTNRQKIQAIENANRYTNSYINFAKSGQEYMFKYQGNGTGTGWTASWTKGVSSFTMSGGTFTSGFRFRAGDVVQFGLNTPVYTVTSDVAFGTTTIPVNRPISQNTGTSTLIYGSAVTYNVICTQLPTYKITPLGILEWSGPFEFIEVVA